MAAAARLPVDAVPEREAAPRIGGQELDVAVRRGAFPAGLGVQRLAPESGSL